MKYNLATRSVHNIPNNKKKSLSPLNNLESINFKIQTPLFKIFMDNNKHKKIHLMKYSINNSKEEKSNKKYEKKYTYIKNNNIYNNPQLIIYKILDAKYNINPKLYSEKIIFTLFYNKKGHLLASFHETLLYDNSLKEYLKRKYKFKESIDKIPKYFVYYKNYLHFFCRPIFSDMFLNKKFSKYHEAIAQVYYSKNYENANNNKNINKNNDIRIFSNKIIEDIEKGDKFTVVTNDDMNKEVQIITNKINKNSINENRLYFFEDEVTPITFSFDGKNTQKSSNYSNFINNNDDIKNNCLLNSEKNILNKKNINQKFIKIEDSSISFLIKEIKENNLNNNNEKIKEEKPCLDNNSLKNNINNISPQKAQEDAKLKITKKIPTFKYKIDKIILSNKFTDKKRTSLGQNNIIKNKINNENENKKLINNLNININNLIINHKIITSPQDNIRNIEYNKLYFNNKDKNQQNNDKIINEIKSILKIDNKNKINILESMDFNSIKKNKFKKNILDLKVNKQILSSNNNDYINKKLNKVNSMVKLSTITMNANKLKQRNASNLKSRKFNQYNSLLRIGGGILDNQGKIMIRHNISGDAIEGQNSLKNISSTKRSLLSSMGRKTGNSNSIYYNKNYNYIFNRDNKKRSVSNKQKRRKIFNSAFSCNLSNDRINANSILSSPNNSKNKKGNNINKTNKHNLNIKFEFKDSSINNKEMPAIQKKTFGQKIFVNKNIGENIKLKLKNFGFIVPENKIKNVNLLSPKRNTFRINNLIKSNKK